MTTSERRKIFCSVTFHVIAVTCVVWSLYVLIDRTAEEIKQGNDNGKDMPPLGPPSQDSHDGVGRALLLKFRSPGGTPEQGPALAAKSSSPWSTLSKKHGPLRILSKDLECVRSW